MDIIAVCGAMWGDEGKGKTISYLSKNSNISIRCNGGSNARHRIIHNNKDLIFSTIPVGICNDNLSIITGNVVINIMALWDDIITCKNNNISLYNKLLISENCNIIFPDHLEINKTRLSKLGTMGQGVGPANASRIMRNGISLKQYLDNHSCGEFKQLSLKEQNILEQIQPYLGNTLEQIAKASQNKSNTILLEGAQGFMLDNVYGTFPFVTSSATGTLGMIYGAGLQNTSLTRNIGVTGAYLTRCMHEPLISRASQKDEEILQRNGNEFMSIIKRWRECFWLDLVALRYSTRMNNFNELCINKLDVLSDLKEIPVCIGYEHKGKIIHDNYDWYNFHLRNYTPVYKVMKGWQSDIKHIREFDHLPIEAKDYIKFIEDQINCPVTIIGNGPESESIIDRTT